LSYLYLIKEELVNIHDAILSESDGDQGIYGGLIDLCVESPQREVYGYEMAAQLWLQKRKGWK